MTAPRRPRVRGGDPTSRPARGRASRTPADAPPAASPLADVRGAGRLLADLTVLVTDVVETMHHNIARRPGVLGRATLDPTRGITGFVYRRVRGVTNAVGGTIDAVLGPLEPLLAAAPRRPGWDAVVSALNGVVGDHLEASGNPLAFAMELRVGGRPLPPTAEGLRACVPAARPRIVVLVHGLCMSDAAWQRNGHDHARTLARRLDADVACLRYNSGRHISTNGGELADLLEGLVARWPVPVRDLVLVGHSMGGLVIRSACADGDARGHAWVRALSALVFLGTPHHGAPLERGGHGVDRLFGASPYTVAFARLGRLRSAGITDLRHGSLSDLDWRGRDRFAHARPPQRPSHRAVPLPPGVPAFAIAGSLADAAPEHGGRPRGDGLVPVANALGLHPDPNRALGIDPARQWIAWGTGHLDLLSSKAVASTMGRWLGATLGAPKPGAARTRSRKRRTDAP